MANTIRLLAADTGKEYVFSESRIFLGRDAGCHICFPEITVISRRHAEIVIRNGSLWILDCHSRNGTWLNRQRLEPGREYPLKKGDLIDLGRGHILRVTEFEFSEPVAGDSVVWGRGFSDGGIRPSMPPVGTCVPAPAPASSRPEPSWPAPPTMPGMSAPPAPSMAPAPMAPPAPAPKKKGGFFSTLFGRKSAKDSEESTVFAPPTSAAPVSKPVTADDVQFRGTAPSTILPGEYFPVKIMMYREDDYQRADRESAAVADRTKSASSSIFQAELNQQFRITLQSPDIELDCESQILRWNGKFAAADYEIYLPEDYGNRQLRLRGRVYSGDAVLTDLKLILQIGAVQNTVIPCEKLTMRTAFISYASADRAKVVARIQGIQLACPDMDLFFDVESLRRGEHWEDRLYREISGRELFYLFWSQNAAKSGWVQKELEYALAQKTLDYIEPIPLEGPDICPPPTSLIDKHFNDWTLRYIGNQ